DVSLLVEGSLTNHQITLDATPPLSEEHIVGLLLVGAEEHSLNSMMPALIVQNLKNLIFSNNQSSFFEKYFKPLLGSFNINLVPSFTDQTGRGGLRGALEISLDDRWRAVIQKNFSLTEDTKFELEFLFSDDITFRAIRDERRDLGGEVEMRWKF
ncbi:MAG TPA: translocation/assembly module TamB domain-containing protein, partial [Candidatus Babeliales bacterium]|nr:translocation/assembly module TamB domain-containing protein [Candidatus Babeliales bacterium]